MGDRGRVGEIGEKWENRGRDGEIQGEMAMGTVA